MKMRKVIIAIHGLANKPDPETEKQWWQAAIEEGLRRACKQQNPPLEIELVYWADLLYKYPLHSEEGFEFDSLYNREPYYEAKPAELAAYDEGWFDLARSRLTETVEAGLSVVRRGLHTDWLTDALLKAKLRDLDFYWDQNRKIKDRAGNLRAARDVLQSELARTLLSHHQAGDEVMLIAHSMGSIISYDVLRDLGYPARQIEVAYYVTIGSPLGLQVVKEKTRHERWDNRVRTPSVVTRRWVNFADPRDPVAVDTHLSNDYAPNSSGVRVEDDLVLNDYHRGEKQNPHKSYGYLRAPEMSRLIAEFLGLPCNA
ncbi:MAG: hypothetical protein AB1631_14870 [Acidobacteriota bacterium]